MLRFITVELLLIPKGHKFRLSGHAAQLSFKVQAKDLMRWAAISHSQVSNDRALVL